MVSAELIKRYESQPFDAIIDCVGIQHIYVNSAKYLKEDGIYSAASVKPASFKFLDFLKSVSNIMLNGIWPISPWLGGTGRRWAMLSMMGADPEFMEKMITMLSEGKFKVVTDSVLPLEDALKGYEVLEKSRARGKIIIQMDENAEV
jgi:reticulon-4-interacting protein 1, mitochondrial